LYSNVTVCNERSIVARTVAKQPRWQASQNGDCDIDIIEFSCGAAIERSP
jgi:hypothetical protein